MCAYPKKNFKKASALYFSLFSTVDVHQHLDATDNNSIYKRWFSFSPFSILLVRDLGYVVL